MKNKIIRTFLTAILVHILLAITLYYTLGWTDELPDELTARPTLVLLGTFASAVLWFNNFRVLFYVIDVSDRKSIDCKIILASLGKMNTISKEELRDCIGDLYFIAKLYCNGDCSGCDRWLFSESI